MSVVKDKDRGTWTASGRVKDKWYKKRGFTTKRDALAWETKYRNEQINTKTCPTVRDVFDLMLEERNRLETSRRTYDVLFHRFDMFADTPVNEITAEDLIRWRISLDNADYGTRTKNQTVALFRSILRYASGVYGVKDTSFALHAFQLTDVERNKEMQVWSVDEYNRFRTCLPDAFWQTLFDTLYWTGMRVGEMLALTRSDLNGDQLTISKSLNGFNHVSATKNKKIRTITVDPVLRAELEALPYDDPLFPVSRYMVRDQLDCTAAASGVTRIRIHDLRHSHVSVLYDHGVSTKAIASRIGDTEAVVMNTYKHLMKNQDDKMNAVIEELHKK